MLMDISYGWILRKSANFHCQFWYRCHKQHNQWYNICVIIIFSWKYHSGLHFYRPFIFLRRNILWFRMKVWVPTRTAKFDQGFRYRWVLSFWFERMKHLKTNCFKHTYIDPRKTYLLLSYHVDSFNNSDFWVRGTNTPPTPNMSVNKLGRCVLFTAHEYNILAPLSTKIYRK